MNWLQKMFGKNPVEETYAPPQKADETQGIWIVYWKSCKHAYSDYAKVSTKFKVFNNKLEAELFKEQIDIANTLLDNQGFARTRIEKQE